MRVQGAYPKVRSRCKHPAQPVLRARYSGTIEVGRDIDGTLFVIGELPFEDYLQGIAEVPRSWPTAALKAQVVAARSYALATMTYPDPTGARLGYQLCATQACQVYTGWAVSHGPDGDRWRQAVRSTRGQVLLSGGRPADALYSSTSPGYTIGNEKVFGGTPLPYLRPVIERDDGASPYAHWNVTLPYRDVARFLRDAGSWGSKPITSVRLTGSTVTVSGGGSSKHLDVATFRSDVNTWSSCDEPDRYPPVDQGLRLAQTIPSVWFATSNLGNEVRLVGRGWGHAVGMVQWGAYGKAKRGLSYGDILAAYYGGLRPRHYDEPATIRIGIATGLRSVTVLADDGPVTFQGSGPTGGPWEVLGGKSLRVRHGRAPVASIEPGTLEPLPERLRSGHRVRATMTLPQRAVVSLVADTPTGDATLAEPATFEPGSLSLSGTVPDLPSGDYPVRAVVTDGVDIVTTSAQDVHIQGVPATPSPTPQPSSPPVAPPIAGADHTGTSVLPWVVAGVVVVGGLSAGAWWRRSRRRRARPATESGPGS